MSPTATLLFFNEASSPLLARNKNHRFYHNYEPAMPASPIASNYLLNSVLNSGHHWQCMAREHPFEGNYGASTITQSDTYENEQSEMADGARAAFG